MQNGRKFKIYNNGRVDRRVYDGDEPPEGFVQGTHYQKTPWNKGITKEDPRVLKNTARCHETRRKNGSYFGWNRGLTKDTDARVAACHENSVKTLQLKYGVTNAGQLSHDAWNKGKTKETDERVRKISESNKGRAAWNKGRTAADTPSLQGSPRPQEVKERIRSTHLSDACKAQRFAALKKNGNLGKALNTKCEQQVYEELLQEFSEDDIICQYFDQIRYPYACDFYVKSADLFVEVQGNWTHGGRPFDPQDPWCIEKLTGWEEKAKISKYYCNAIYTWTDLDVRKATIARQNNLNIRYIYPYSK